MDTKLTIVIPTYNRAPYVGVLLSELSDYQHHGLKFNVTLCNNGSPDNTLEVVDKWKDKIEGFNLINHDTNLGYDGNLLSGYDSVETEYCWMFGDSYHVEFSTIKGIVEDLDSGKYDALILHCWYSMTIPSRTYTYYLDVFKEQGWHITNICSCVIRREFINNISLDRYQNTYFLHYGVFMEYLSLKKNVLVKYDSDREVIQRRLSELKKTNWMAKPFGVFGRQWFMMIMSLPNTIPIELKRNVILDHNRYTHIFDSKNVFKAKAHRNHDYVLDYKQYRWYFKHVVPPRTLIFDDFIIYCLPTKLLSLIHNAFVCIKKHVKK